MLLAVPSGKGQRIVCSGWKLPDGLSPPCRLRGRDNYVNGLAQTFGNCLIAGGASRTAKARRAQRRQHSALEDVDPRRWVVNNEARAWVIKGHRRTAVPGALFFWQQGPGRALQMQKRSEFQCISRTPCNTAVGFILVPSSLQRFEKPTDRVSQGPDISCVSDTSQLERAFYLTSKPSCFI